MTESTLRSILLALASLAVLTGTAAAQDTVVYTPPPGDAAPADDGGGGGLSLELQGRLSILSDFDIAFGGPRFMPPVAIGLRLLDDRLYIGAGLVYSATRVKGCFGGDCTTDTNGQLFGVAPVITFDVLSRGGAHLYPLLTMTFARNELISTAPGGDDDDFAWGANVGLGIRGDLGPAVSIGSEWGWGFLRANDSAGMASISVMQHGFFGTVNVSARIGL